MQRGHAAPVVADQHHVGARGQRGPQAEDVARQGGALVGARLDRRGRVAAHEGRDGAEARRGELLEHGPQRGRVVREAVQAEDEVPDARLQVVQLDRPEVADSRADHRDAPPTRPSAWCTLASPLGLPGRADPSGGRRAVALTCGGTPRASRDAASSGRPPHRAKRPVCAARNARRGAGTGPPAANPQRAGSRPHPAPRVPRRQPSAPSSHPAPAAPARPPARASARRPGRAPTRRASSWGSAWWPWRSSSG